MLYFIACDGVRIYLLTNHRLKNYVCVCREHGREAVVAYFFLTSGALTCMPQTVHLPGKIGRAGERGVLIVK